MGLEVLISKGDKALANKDVLSAISSYSEAAKSHPEAFAPYIKRCQAYTQLKDFDSAKADVSRAFAAAQASGRREKIGLCHFRLGLVNYAEADYELAVVNFRRAAEHLCPEKLVEIWLAKAEKEAAARGVRPADAVEPTEGSSTSVQTINKQAPIKEKIRQDWYQGDDSVTVAIYAKHYQRELLAVRFGAELLEVLFVTSEGSEYRYEMEPLFAVIDPKRSSYKVLPSRIDVVLAKVAPGKWSSLEKKEVEVKWAYPLLAKAAKNWGEFKVEEPEEKVDFIQKLFRDQDADTRRAMMKSYVESNGTVLTTSWDDAKDQTFTTQPPDGMVEKKWAI